jgi:protein ImuB
MRRYLSIWFPYLKTDWFTRQESSFRNHSFVLRMPSHGRMIITAANENAQLKGIEPGMVLADARAVIPDLKVMDDIDNLPEKLLTKLAAWAIRFTPSVAIDPPDGLMLDVTGCPHLWGGEEEYANAIRRKLTMLNYAVRIGLADTPGVAWAMARFGKHTLIVSEGETESALISLPPEALRLEQETCERLHKLGLHTIAQFIGMPRHTLRRRFGNDILLRIDLALGREVESITPCIPPEPYSERLPCLEPIVTAEGIAMGLRTLLETICLRLQQEQKGLRTAVFTGYRVDGIIERIGIETNRPSHHVDHLFKLFENRLTTIDPGLGIELFVLNAPKVEDHFSAQGKIWEAGGGLSDHRLAELLDKIGGRVGMDTIHRYLPSEHYWPERSIRVTTDLLEEPGISWRTDKRRPSVLLPNPEPIEVTAPIPDYPPMLFRFKGKVYNISKADGPERIEQEWWLQQGQHRDYYYVEDEEGKRYWIFRLGHYDDKVYKWFLHGYFA